MQVFSIKKIDFNKKKYYIIMVCSADKILLNSDLSDPKVNYNLTSAGNPISHRSSSPVGVLLLHGFTGTPHSMQHLADTCIRAGYNVECPCFAGHGTHWREMNKVNWKDWLQDAQNALQLLTMRSTHVFIAGLSMGGALAFLVKSEEKIKGIILINHALFVIHNWKARMLSVCSFFLPGVWSGPSDISDFAASANAYPWIPLRALRSFLRITGLAKKAHSAITVPVLIFKSIQDRVISIHSVWYTLREIKCTVIHLVWLQNSRHTATADYDKTIISGRTLAFIKDTLQQ